MNVKQLVLDELLSLIEDYHDYNPSNATRIDTHPTAVSFARQVARGFPCVYPAQQALQGETALKWSRQSLIDAVHEEVEVAITPDGRADSLCNLDDTTDEKVFLQPATANMRLATLFNLLDDAGPREQQPVYYLQSQNSNLTSTPLQTLLQDLPSNFDFAVDVLGEPEAVNIWIGDERSVTSAHRDPYENLYVVLRGSKTFTLWPPVDEVCMDMQMVRTGRYTYNSTASTFEVVMDHDDRQGEDTAMIPWIPVDPCIQREVLDLKHPLYKHAKPMTVEVSAGEMLYLPSGWFHHVAQQCGNWDDGTPAPCVAVNYWYDMDYEGERYVNRQLIGRLSQIVQTPLPEQV